MKKLLFCVVLFGTTIGVVRWLCTKEKNIKEKNNKEFNSSPEINNQHTVSVNNQTEKKSQKIATSETFEQDKSECSQAILNRHSEAGAMMKAAYQNIMEDFVEDFPDESIMEKNNEVAIDIQDISVIKELDSISDDLDDLLK